MRILKRFFSPFNKCCKEPVDEMKQLLKEERMEQVKDQVVLRYYQNGACCVY
ncbi:hypothetical protein [Shouchella tritolerans]|uniref:hypothetical protein n=1 Tax=Shouchella tritolerans TaxID=2979466 RepID=UPI000A5BFFE1|nr:hypothetical protein [Shouchella tritolerans]